MNKNLKAALSDATTVLIIVGAVCAFSSAILLSTPVWTPLFIVRQWRDHASPPKPDPIAGP